jgi:hypothetical protein
MWYGRGSTAIRERSREPNWCEYEFARAVCRIHLDQQFNQQQKSTLDLQVLIRADLNTSGGLSAAQKKQIDPDNPNTKEGATTTWGKLN